MFPLGLHKVPNGAGGNFNPGLLPPQLEYYEILGAVRDITMRVEMQLTCVLRTGPGFRTGDAPHPVPQGVSPP